LASYARVSKQGSYVYASIDASRAQPLDRAPWLGGQPSGAPFDVTRSDFVCPVEPSKILGIGRNYREHAKELGHDVPSEPLVFFKPPSALLGTGKTVLLPPESARVDYEGELGVVIGRRCRRVRSVDALEYVFGYVAVCDVTARDLQKKDGQWARAKGFDGFCPVGPIITTGVDPTELGVRLEVNGDVRQDGNTRDMIFPVAQLIAHASAAMTLEPGDLIATGTPEGVGPLKAGDRVLVRIERVGELEFDVATE
jgi:2-keto-4-pentenoate hydratase/2-oxohepta-3-ene-1,7-dioic acid hydratase in catechol pathway